MSEPAQLGVRTRPVLGSLRAPVQRRLYTSVTRPPAQILNPPERPVTTAPPPPRDSQPQATSASVVSPLINHTNFAPQYIPPSSQENYKVVLPPKRGIRGWIARYTKLQLLLILLAFALLAAGAVVVLQTRSTNAKATAQVKALSQKVNAKTTNSSAVPSATKPSASEVAAYTVAPNLPKLLKIPKIGVDARILQVGVTSSGALAAPPNIYDTAWYTGSAEPGQPGATLIDGHVSSWTSHGVFYSLKNLAAGDSIQIVKGDNTVVNYQVVQTQAYPSNNVNMYAAITPVVAGKSGLNLITCTGQVIKGTSEFNQRLIVFAEQV